MRQGKASYVFPGSNTPEGFVSFYREGLSRMETVFILKGGPGCGKSTLMRKIGLNMLERGYDIEFWQCSSDNDSLDGVLVPALAVAIVDGTAPHTLDPQFPGVVEEIVNLGEHWQGSELRQHKQEIIDINRKIGALFSAGYQKLEQAGALYQTTAEQIQPQQNSPSLDEIRQSLSDVLFHPPTPRSRHLFASAVTPRGLLSFAEVLSLRAQQRYILLGPPGCGKESLLSQLAREAEACGHVVDLFHHTLAPQQLQLLYLPQLSIAVWATETPPETSRENDILYSLRRKG